MKRNIAFIIAAVMLTLSCGEGVTDSRERIIRAPQDMIWTADTLKGHDQYASLYPENLIVFSPNDAWLVCWSDIARRLIWHFDGKTWSESNIQADVGGMRVNDIAGYSSSDLWTCGYTGNEIFLAHYNGSHWEKYNTNGIKGELLDMCKDNDGNLWACGRNGVVMKYDKTKWHVDYINIPGRKPEEYWINGIGYLDGKINLTVSFSSFEQKREEYFHVQGSMNNWVIIDSAKIQIPPHQSKWGTWNFGQSNNKLYSFGCGGIWQLKDKWEPKHQISYCSLSAYEVNENYFLAGYQFNKLYFFNGSTWTNIGSMFNNIDFTFGYHNIWSNGYETFIVGLGLFGREEKLVVWRGK